MSQTVKNYGQVIFSIIGALVIMAAAWATRGSEDSDVWLYAFSLWMILFSAFEVRTSLKIARASKMVLAVLVGAFAIIVGAWWANGAEHLNVFIVSGVVLVAAFLALSSRTPDARG